ncbi:DUF3604 domain-containing protein [Sphingorhabdus sp. Alg231-15]|uniref:DUF3604 domain-containing protein n=1 Tax=Sphingorhabdus sp. Alg231-15 TaxID=1922222 RepID=UPI00307C3F9D
MKMNYLSNENGPHAARLKRIWVRISASFLLASAVLITGCSGAPSSDNERGDDSSVTLTEYPEQVYWGDLHLHTLYSFDSYNFGNKTLGPDEAYRFAQGEEVDAHGGRKAKLEQPLDFLMVSDHAEFTGVFLGMEKGNPDIADTPLGKAWAAMNEAGDTVGPMNEVVASLQEGNAKRQPPEKFRRTIWSELVEAAERHNKPGKFTTFAGYEWTSMPGGGNQHRVVVFKDDKDKTLQTIPFSAADSNNPLDLWRYLANYEETTGGEVLAIAHNGNVSNGNMFGDIQSDGTPFDQEYVDLRARWEPLYETTQVKGDGEAHPLLSPDDEFADFETWDDTNISMVPRPTDPDKKREVMRGEYAREGLKQGLELQERFGVNPYQYGLIGSTDTHTGLATADDDNFWGKFVESEPGKERITSKMGGRLWDNWRLTSSGYVGAWARANTRAELFAAFKRKEVYATTGPRMAVRFFGGWDYKKSDIEKSDFAGLGYAKGVPMGGILKPGAGSPSFMVTAAKDPNGANLDRVQVIKGWRSSDGQLHEKIYEVRFAGERIVDPATGKIPAIGSTVNLTDATYTNDIGEPFLATVWSDPDFNPKVAAFYYVRVLEIPTPRWTLYDAVRYKVKPPKEVPLITQERAYSSPIWYSPS